jgi:hypothetical protein
MRRPLATTSLKVDDYHLVKFMIWPDIDSLQEATGQPDAGGYWESPEIRIHVDKDGSVTVINKVVSTIHLYIKGFGAGVFAHELQHFIQFWISLGVISKEDEEAIPNLAMSLTSDFWNWFYDTFKEEKSGKKGQDEDKNSM